MDINTETELIENALAAARANGLNVRLITSKVTGDEHEIDAQVSMGNGTKYQVEVKRGLRPATLGAVIHRLKSIASPSLLIADYITPPLAKTLRENNIPFLDTAGNAYINDPPVLVWIKGERPKSKLADQQAVGRAFRPSGLKVVFAFLCDTELVGLPYRDIAERADVSRGTVGEVIVDLTGQNFVSKIDGKRKLFQAERLLRQFADAYARRLRPKLILGRYTSSAENWWKDLDQIDQGYVLGGEAAAAHLTSYLRPGSITLFALRADPRFLIAKKLRADPNGNVEILKKFWTGGNADKPIAPLPLVYADLLVSGDARCIEAADKIYEQIVNGFD